LREKLRVLNDQLCEGIIGAERAAYQVLVGLLAKGHILLQGEPGIGKTALAARLSHLISADFKRVQFTPDLLPSDLLGYSMYNQGSHEFEFVKGPVFCNILLADEINRTSPRIQSALLECMNEQQVTIDNNTYKLASPFMVIATQNNLYATGTFPLPEPQLDRFHLSIQMEVPDVEAQPRILEFHASGKANQAPEPVMDAAELIELQEAVARVPVNRNVCNYIVALCEATREHPGVVNGISPRGSIALMRAAQAVAFLNGHAAVFPDDVKFATEPVFHHRLKATTKGGTKKALIQSILEETPVP